YRYVEKLVAGHRERIRLNTPVKWLKRHADRVEVKTTGAAPESFDQVILACHSDQALALLADPSPEEREVLGAIAYQRNEAVLHTDHSLMPRRPRAWAAWNYHIPATAETSGRVALTYNMNILQSLETEETYCVTLNHTDAIAASKIIRRLDYSHPIFNERTLLAQQRQREINGVRRSYYCGAYWRYGFHEDGVVSAMAALDHLDADLTREASTALIAA
ncbi:MAG TPA: FAD-dependent oxidoreductase, partial [Xanthomonadales bacterium]|nr:FAD-dependent oxidoreductase [Xanthomonadales bacterium]